MKTDDFTGREGNFFQTIAVLRLICIILLFPFYIIAAAAGLSWRSK